MNGTSAESNVSSIKADRLRALLHPVRSLRHTVRGKLVGVVLLTTTVVLLISGIAMLAHDLAVYRSSWASDIATEASILAVSAAPALAFDDLRVAQSNLQSLTSRSAILAAALYTADDRLYAQYVSPNEEPPPAMRPSDLTGLSVAGERVELAQPIRYNNEYLGTLYLRARYDVKGRVLAYLGIFSLITLASLIAAFILSAVLQRLITVPLEAIGAVARQIVDKQDYSLRVTQTTNDEIGMAAQALNSMLGEVQQRSQALEASNRALQHADQRKDEFLATLAHELRNPLAPIRHATRILESPNAKEEQRKWGREVIARQVEHMALLLDDLLDVSRITRGRLELKSEYVSLQSIVEAAVETARPLIDSKRHALQTKLPSEPLDVHVDPLRMSQALSNLLTNAAKYTDPGGTIVVAARRSNDGLTLEVVDSGIGLQEHSLATVFEMFSQVTSALERSQGGLGIGLALVKGLVSLHGGTVEARSAGLGRGSTFVVHLPHACIVEKPAYVASNIEPNFAGGTKRRILVTDDNRDAADSLAMLLQVVGHETFIAYDGAACLDVASRERPDACILDIGMPGMSGYEVAQQIRERPWGKDMVLIALTGWGQRDDVARAIDAGFDHHCTKPVDAHSIDQHLKSLLESRRSARDRTGLALAEGNSTSDATTR